MSTLADRAEQVRANLNALYRTPGAEPADILSELDRISEDMVMYADQVQKRLLREEEEDADPE
jgi:hypothetical protein